VDQHLLRLEVQVVGRLVEHEEVGRVEQHARHHEARLLAARERPDLLVHVVARELERAEQVAQHADRLVREVLLDLLPDRQVRVEQVERLLGEVAHLEARAERTSPASGLERARHHLEQRRLAGAVAAHHAPALAAPDREVQPS
jgi:hypothetical protein